VTLLRQVFPALFLAFGVGFVHVQDGKVHFDPVRDLPGYEFVRASQDKDLYPLEAFDALLGDEMDVVQLAATRKRWTEERAAVDEKLAELAGDPRAAFLFRLETRLGRHAYFSKIGWEIQEALAPFVFVVQRPSKDDPAHARKIVDLYQPWLATLARVFDARAAGPTKLEPNANHVHTDQPISIDRIEITGGLDAASLARARSDWIERRHGDLGF